MEIVFIYSPNLQRIVTKSPLDYILLTCKKDTFSNLFLDTPKEKTLLGKRPLTIGMN